MEQYLDLRILKTREELYKALFEMLKDKTRNLEKIKVLDVCEKANITAMTFYKHFDNSTQLIESAIKDQIGNRLPIPLKLKPQNLKQLFYYVIDFFQTYISNNKEIIINAIIYCSNKGYKDTYIDLLFKLILYYFKKEMHLIFNQLDNISINIWSEFIVGGLFYLFVNRIINNKTIEKLVIFDNLKIMNRNFK